jgi:hypothetical protein
MMPSSLNCRSLALTMFFVQLTNATSMSHVKYEYYKYSGTCAGRVNSVSYLKYGVLLE